MAHKKKSRRYWLGELKRAELEKSSFIAKLMEEKFSGIDPTDADAVLSAQRFCERAHVHFVATFGTWINDNYPADVKAPQLFDTITTGSLASAKIFKKAFGENFNIKVAGND